MKFKAHWKILVENQLPLILGYVGLTLMFWGLCALYGVSNQVVIDLIRFTWIPLAVVVGYRLLTQNQLMKNLETSFMENRLPSKPRSPLMGYYWQYLVKGQAQHVAEQQSLQNKLRKKTDYLKLWGHEIKLPLTALQLLAENQAQVPSDELQQQLQFINHQLELLLNYERLADFHHDLAFKWLSVEQIVTPIIQEYSIFFINKGITPKLSFHRAQVLTDKKWLTFVIKQLVFNALKYSTSNSSLEILWDGHRLMIRDHGIGIASEDLPRVFEPGFTGHNGRQQQAATGMGLYISKQVINQLGEKMTISSTLKEGTTATIIFQSAHIKTL